MADYDAVLRYIHDYWPKITRHNPKQRDTLVGLPNPYLVPSDHEMFQEMYYWDSYFMALGVMGTEHEAIVPGMAENLGHMMELYGVIPNASRYYFMSRSQPPFFTQLIWLGYEVLKRQKQETAEAWLEKYMTIAEREHDTVWMGTSEPHCRKEYRDLSRYFDINFLDILASCESGWDHSTRCDDRWLEHLPVDLNSILYVREMDFARFEEQRGDKKAAKTWQDRAKARAETMNELMWDERAGFFYDYDYVHRERNPHVSLAGFYPMWAGFATKEQASQMVKTWLPKFECLGGLVTTLDSHPGRQWAYPNGWAPLQWLVTAGLDRYGFTDDATRIRGKWCDLCAEVFKVTGQMWEKYSVVDKVRADETESSPETGLYGDVRGFGWSNAVFADFVRKLDGSKEHGTAASR